MTIPFPAVNSAGKERKNAMFQIGDRVIWKPIDYRDHSQDTNHRWYGAIGTVTKLCRFYACIALDDFPEVNYREVKNHFWVDFEELEQVK